MPFFIDKSLNYPDLSLDCRTNNYIENYNRYIKNHLGNRRLVNSNNFIDFIKIESNKSITKLLDNNNVYKKYSCKNSYTNRVLENNKFNFQEYIDTFNDNDNLLNNNDNNSNENFKDFKINNINVEINNLLESKIGILNVSNSCFINSSIQILIHYSIFMSKYINNAKIINENEQIISYKL